MKKQFMLLTVALLFIITANAQNIPETTLGLRLGGNNGFNTEISAQFNLTGTTRLEGDLGLRLANQYYGWSLYGLHEWIYELGGEFQWYWGAGAGLGNWNNYKRYESNNDGGYFAVVSGIIGLEYFPASYPIQVSLDLRPRLGLFNVWDSAINADPAISIRYIF